VQWMFSPIAIFPGMLSVLQSVCNGMLEKVVDRPITVALISLSIGVMMLIPVGAVFGQLGFATSERTVQAPWWVWLGGLCGALALLSQPIAVPRLGAAIYIGLSVTASKLRNDMYCGPRGETITRDAFDVVCSRLALVSES
jgi:transporter family-2 protein